MATYPFYVYQTAQTPTSISLRVVDLYDEYRYCEDGERHTIQYYLYDSSGEEVESGTLRLFFGAHDNYVEGAYSYSGVSDEFTIEGLTPGEKYLIDVWFELGQEIFEDGWLRTTSIDSTKYEMEIGLTSITGTSVSFVLYDAQKYWEGFNGIIDYTLNGEYVENAFFFTWPENSAISEEFTISGLSPNTEYTLEIGLRESLYSDPSISFTTPSLKLKPTNLVAVRIDRGYIISWDALADADYYKCRDKLTTATSWVTGGTLNKPSRTRTGRKCCKTYDIGVQAFWGNGTTTDSDDIGGGWCFNYSITMTPPRIYIESISATNNGDVILEWDLYATANDETITVYCSLIDSSGKSIANNISVDTSVEKEYGTITFTNVPEGNYTAKIYTGFVTPSGVEIYCVDNEGNPYIDTAVITVQGGRPSDWDWEETDVRYLAYLAITGAGTTSEFKYSVWNDMVAKTLEFLTYLDECETLVGTNTFGFESDLTLSEVLSLAEMSSTTSGRTLTYTRFNALNCVICKIAASTGISAKKKNDTVCGWFFTTLMSTLNSIS